jgi:drug/metabolite transporter (DMT)-like permease
MRRVTSLRGRNLAVYVFLCAVWGSTWLFIKVTVADLPPLRAAAYRMALACLVLVPLALRRKARGVTSREARQVAWNGLLQIGLSYALVFTAAQWIDSGLSALLFATFPIWVAVFAHLILPGEPITRRTAAAAVLGLAGVAVIQAPAIARLAEARFGLIAAGGALVLGSAVASGYSNALVKKHLSNVSPIFNIWGQTLVGAAFLFAASALLERGQPSHWSPKAIGALAYLAVLGTAVTFAMLFWLIPRVPVAVIGTIPLVDTVIAVLLGALVLGERLSPRLFVGAALILGGVVLAGTSRAETPRAG